MEFEIDDKRCGNTCNQVKGKIIVEDDGVRLTDPDGYTLIHLPVNGKVYFDPEKWGTEYHLKLRSGYEHTYDLEKKC